MEIHSVKAFLSYYQKTREITTQFIKVIPPDKMDWTYSPKKFTIADIIRHIAAIERNVFAEAIIGNPINYNGCGKELANGYDEVVRYFDEMHTESMQIFKLINDEDLFNKIESLDGKEVTTSNFLRALIVHEIHHRGALAIYLNLINVKTPPILGFTEEQVLIKSKSLENLAK